MSVKKNRSHSKIDRLPENLKREVENRLLEGHTYDEIADYLKQMGQDIHYSTVARYGKPFLEKFEAVRMAKEYAQMLAEDNPDRPTTELHEANNALVSQMIMESLINPELSPEEKLRAAKDIAVLQRAQVSNEKLKIDSRKAQGEVKEALKKLKEQVYSEVGTKYPDIADSIIKIADEIEKTSVQQ